MQQRTIPAAAALLMLTAVPWAAAQPEPDRSPPKVTPQVTVPLPQRINRNPAYRAQLPEAPLPPADPRDSSVRPVLPPGSSDSRDTVLTAPGQAAQPGAAASAPRQP
ncbi:MULTISPECIES: hypothetical protein [unclassified Polaromonas]|uniref:hypothetical protein n=1 Tax=unclassified Polaromonas TaxID=2638319 RepID=UPI000F085C2E|nr:MULTISPECIES: hypothetical protein [unclassified Polaromonas]AYQ27737.1 hypothetical protein DT070_06680 [Polaromonas sp. SP1]QGJ17410.1 hypothetical protein F7R28_02740 [Polaromonas sp. Pch-P]